MAGEQGVCMSEQDNLNAIVEMYTTGPVHNSYNDAEAQKLFYFERILVETHCLNKDAEILNLGCGAGRETFALYLMGYRHVTGVDCTLALLETARNRVKTSGFNIQFTLAFAHNLPFPDSTFDVVTMFYNIYGHITPHSERLRSLAEVRRVLKPGGLVLMSANSLLTSWSVFSFIKTQEIIRLFYNPHKMERGDKIMRGARKQKKGENMPLARSHWFRPCEIPEDARTVGLTVIQATTIKGLLRKPNADCAKIHGQCLLIYVLKKPV